MPVTVMETFSRAWPILVALIMASTAAGQTPPLPAPAPSVAPEIPGVVKGGTTVELLKTGFGGSEGPISAPDGSLLFTTGNTITRLDPGGNFSTFLENTAGVTGLAYDSQGRLIAARTDPAAILMLLPTRQVLVDSIAQLPLLRPNDLTIDKRGGIYFSDQPRRPEQTQVPSRQKGILYIRPDGSVVQVATSVETPNGVVLSREERTLYTAETRTIAATSTREFSVLAFDVQSDGTLRNERILSRLGGRPDGIAVDGAGRIYVATGLGVEVLEPSGRHLGTIPITGGTGPQNLAFAGRDKKTLYVVGARAIWRIQMEAQGVSSANGLPV